MNPNENDFIGKSFSNWFCFIQDINTNLTKSLRLSWRDVREKKIYSVIVREAHPRTLSLSYTHTYTLNTHTHTWTHSHTHTRIT